MISSAGKMMVYDDKAVVVYRGEDGQLFVSARDLWQGVESGTQFSKFFSRNTGYCMLQEGVDYIRIEPAFWGPGSPGREGHWQDAQGSEMTNLNKSLSYDANYRVDYLLTFEAAKEIALIQRSTKAHRVRRRLIELEKEWRARQSPEAASPAAGTGAMVPAGGSLPRAAALQLPEAAVFSRKADDLLSAMGRMDARLKTLTADADFGRAVGDAGDLITATQIAKEFGLSAVAFNRLLSSLGIQYKRSGQWLLYARYDGLGYTRTVYTTVIHQDGRRTIALTTKWTPRGRRFLHDFLKRRGVMPGALAAGEPVAVGEEGDRDA